MNLLEADELARNIERLKMYFVHRRIVDGVTTYCLAIDYTDGGILYPTGHGEMERQTADEAWNDLPEELRVLREQGYDYQHS